jgi:hypothetical protein
LQLFVQKYSKLTEWDGWDHLSEDVEFVQTVEELPMCELDVQYRTLMGVVSTNGQHHTGRGVLVGENWKETYER